MVKLFPPTCTGGQLRLMGERVTWAGLGFRLGRLYLGRYPRPLELGAVGVC